MNTQTALIHTICSTTTLIQERYPELSKYLEEMPYTNCEMTSSVVSDKCLAEYARSLSTYLTSYAKNH